MSKCIIYGILDDDVHRKQFEQSRRVYDPMGISPTIHTQGGGGQEVKVAIGAIRGRNPENPTCRDSGQELTQTLEIKDDGTANALTTVQKDNIVLIPQRKYDEDGNRSVEHKESNISPAILATQYKSGDNQPKVQGGMRIRKLTPLECFRLQDFDDEDFYKAKASGVSNSQLYRQAGNSITIGVLEAIFKQMI